MLGLKWFEAGFGGVGQMMYYVVGDASTITHL